MVRSRAGTTRHCCWRGSAKRSSCEMPSVRANRHRSSRMWSTAASRWMGACPASPCACSSRGNWTTPRSRRSSRSGRRPCDSRQAEPNTDSIRRATSSARCQGVRPAAGSNSRSKRRTPPPRSRLPACAPGTVQRWPRRSPHAPRPWRRARRSPRPTSMRSSGTPPRPSCRCATCRRTRWWCAGSRAPSKTNASQRLLPARHRRALPRPSRAARWRRVASRRSRCLTTSIPRRR